jgi:hypothetical protein
LLLQLPECGVQDGLAIEEISISDLILGVPYSFFLGFEDDIDLFGRFNASHGEFR